MEKCTYCVQRIERRGSPPSSEDRTLGGDEVVTACQAACPTRAIVFGNLNDKASAVVKAKADPRNYALLAELNTRPRTTYLAKLTNPDPDAAEGGLTRCPHHRHIPPGEAPRGAVLEAGPHLRHGHGQDQRDRADPAVSTGAGSSGSGSRSLLMIMLLVAVAYLFLRGVGIWGVQTPGDVGVRDRQLRLVDRHRPRRDPDLGDPAAAQAGVADVDQPVRRGDDPLRRRLRGDVPAAPPGAAVGLLLALPVPEHDGHVAAVAQPAGLGRLRRLDLRDRLAPVLVRRPDPRPGDPPRPRAERGSARSSTASSRWAGAARRGTGTATGRPTCCWPRWRRRWSSRSTRS